MTDVYAVPEFKTVVRLNIPGCQPIDLDVVEAELQLEELRESESTQRGIIEAFGLWIKSRTDQPVDLTHSQAWIAATAVWDAYEKLKKNLNDTLNLAPVLASTLFPPPSGNSDLSSQSPPDLRQKQKPDSAPLPETSLPPACTTSPSGKPAT